MKSLKIAGFVAAIAIALGSWAASNAASDPVANDSRKPAPTRSIDHPTGATETRGSAPGDMTSTPTPEKEQQRGNTPPGKDREGQGPAAGAIIDPSGAATGRKP